MLAVTGIGSFLAVVNTTSLLIAIPQIMIQLKMSFFTVLWIIISYSISLTVLSPILGKHSDRVGRKKLYSLGYLFFFAGSMIAGFGINGGMIIAARVVQGAGGALLFSNSLAIITDSFKGMEMKRSMGVNGAIVAFSTAIGPVIGGIMTMITWRAVFFFNAPIALAGYAWSLRSLRESNLQLARKKIDYLGAVSLSVSLISFISYLTLSPMIGWFGELTIGILIVSAVSLIYFIIEERRSTHPLIEISLFKNSRFLSSTVAVFLNSIARFSVVFLLILYLQGPAGFNAFFTGVLIMPYAVSMGLMSYYVGPLMKKIKEENLEIIGLAFSGVGILSLSITRLYFPYILLSAIMVVVGIGLGTFYTPNNTVLMLSVGPTERGIAAGIRSLTLNIGSVIGMTLVFTILASIVSIQTIGNVFLGLSGGMTPVEAMLFVKGLDFSYLIIGVLALLPIAALWKK